MQPNYYRGKKNQNPGDGPKKAPQYPEKKKPCPDGFTCYNYVQLSNCKFEHDGMDKPKGIAWDKLKSKGMTIIFFEAAPQEGPLIPKFIRTPELPIKIESNPGQEALYKIGHYYEATYAGINNVDKVVLLKNIKEISKFGSLKDEVTVQKILYGPYYLLEEAPEKQRSLNGVIRVNEQNKMRLYNMDGQHKPVYLRQKALDDYPLLEQAKVRYFLRDNNSRQPYIYSIKYTPFNFSGIVQITDKGQLYVMCRNEKYDKIDITELPGLFVQQLKELQQILPYSMLIQRNKNVQNVKELNKKLKDYLFTGQFELWQPQFVNPIGSLNEEYSKRSLKSLKEAVIYEYNISSFSYSREEETRSTKLSKTIQQAYEKEQKILEGYVFTVDGRGTRCHDDAISIAKSDKDLLTVGIHISDVDEFVRHGDFLDERVKKKDRTVYVKGYYSPMFCKELMKSFSLIQKNKRYTLTLKFDLDAKGLIDFSSVQFKKTCIEIAKNYFHSRKLLEQPELQNFFHMSRIIEKSSLLDENYQLINDQESERAVDSLMLLSSMIPTFMFKINCRRVEAGKKGLQSFFEQLVKTVKQQVKQWEAQIKTLKQSEKKLVELREVNAKISRKITNEVNQKLREAKKKEKQEKKALQKEKPDKKPKKQRITAGRTAGQSSQQTDDAEESQSIKSQLEVPQQQIGNQKEIKESKQDQKQETERQKLLKEMFKKQVKIKIKKVQEQSESSDSDSSINQGNEAYMMNQAKSARDYMQKILKILKVEIDWQDRHSINDMFRRACDYDKSPLLKQFIERMKILNSQYFRYISKIYRNQRQKKNIQKTKNQKNKKELDQSVQQNVSQEKKENFKQRFVQKDVNNVQKKAPQAEVIQKDSGEKHQNVPKTKINEEKAEKIQIETIKVKQLQFNLNEKETVRTQKQKGRKNEGKKAKTGKYQQKTTYQKATQTTINLENIPISGQPKKEQAANKQPEKIDDQLKIEGNPTKQESLDINKSGKDKVEIQIVKISKMSDQNKQNPSQKKLQCQSEAQDNCVEIQQKVEADIKAEPSLESTKPDENLQKKQIQQQSAVTKKENKKVVKKISRKKQEEMIKAELVKEIKIKYEEEIKSVEEKLGEVSKVIEDKKETIRGNLSKVDKQYNVLEYIVNSFETKSKKDKKKSKPKKSKKSKKEKQEEESQDQQQYQYLNNIFKILENYRKLLKHKFSILKQAQIQQYLADFIKLESAGNNQQLNQEFQKITKDQQHLLKWNNPIRSYAAIETLRLIKEYTWVFNGKISPLDILSDFKALQQVNLRIQNINKYKREKMAAGQSDKKYKEANRQIEKIQFYYRMKEDEGKKYTLLNITSPNEREEKFVFHPLLGEVSVLNHEFKQEYFREVSGTLKIISDFPIEIKAILVR